MLIDYFHLTPNVDDPFRFYNAPVVERRNKIVQHRFAMFCEKAIKPSTNAILRRFVPKPKAYSDVEELSLYISVVWVHLMPDQMALVGMYCTVSQLQDIPRITKSNSLSSNE